MRDELKMLYSSAKRIIFNKCINENVQFTLKKNCQKKLVHTLIHFFGELFVGIIYRGYHKTVNLMRDEENYVRPDDNRYVLT